MEKAGPELDSGIEVVRKWRDLPIDFRTNAFNIIKILKESIPGKIF